MALMGMTVASGMLAPECLSFGLASAIKSAFAFTIKLSLVIDSLRMAGIDLTF